MRLVLTLSLLASSLCTAQSFVRAPQGIETVQSKLFEGAEISYKKVGTGPREPLREKEH